MASPWGLFTLKDCEQNEKKLYVLLEEIECFQTSLTGLMYDFAPLTIFRNLITATLEENRVNPEKMKNVWLRG